MMTTRPCLCDNCPIGTGFSSEDLKAGKCFDCWRYYNVPKWRVIWSGRPFTASDIGFSAPRAGVDCCGAVEAAPAGFTGKRHLLFHVYPTKGKGIWQLNCQRLLSRIRLFDGKRSVAIVVGPETDSVEDVQRYFRGERIDHWHVHRNDPSLWEVNSWTDLWSTLEGQSLDDAAFWCQAKGVTRAVNRFVSVHRWTRLMYSANLDYWPVVSALLDNFPVVGCLHKSGLCFPGSTSSWHFSGSFFWGRLRDCIPRYRMIDRVSYWGAESWPGLHFAPHQAGVLFGIGGGDMNLYSMDKIAQYELEFERWTQAIATTRAGSATKN